MPSRDEAELHLDRFEGTNLLLDSTLLGPAYLRRSENWIPGETFRLEKRPGATQHPAGEILTASAVKALFAASRGTSRYLYAVATFAGTDTLVVSTNDGAWATVTSGTFTTASTTYGIEQLGDIVYVSNGTDVPKKIDLSSSATTATNLTAITSFTDGSAAPTPTTDAGATLLTGTYAYCWAIFDHTSGVYVERGQTREITLRQTTDQSLSFPIPTGFASNGGALSSRYRGHLFVAPVNFPVEFAHDQTPEGIQATATILRQLVIDGPVVPLRNAVRRGASLRSYFGRLILAGDTTNTTSVWATATLSPGLEQTLFNAGEFFPANGRLPRTPNPVTAIGVAATGERGRELAGPLVVCTLSRTFLYTGDVLDDPGAAFIQVAARAGCIGFRACTETPYGFFYIGTETVWCVPTGGGTPIDVGWPIRPAIKAIPVAQREKVLMAYHKGFLKCWIVPSGGTTANTQWWLDLRRGLSQIPAWFGPHSGAAVTAVAVSQVEPDEPDRAWHAVSGGGVVEMIHQPNRWTEYAGTIPILSVLQTAELTAGRTFDRKLWSRVRLLGFVETATSLSARVVMDGGFSTTLDALTFTVNAATVWDATWDADWGQMQYAEAESVFPAARPRARSLTLQLSHGDARALGLRDIEFRYHPIVRPTRSTTAQES